MCRAATWVDTLDILDALDALDAFDALDALSPLDVPVVPDALDYVFLAYILENRFLHIINSQNVDITRVQLA